jgi:signal peptidase II
VTKLLAERLLTPRYVPHRIIGDVVRFTLAYNPGAAFSLWLGEHSRQIFGSLAVIALFLLWRMYRICRMAGTGARSGDLLRIVALALAWGGAAGNLIDRFRSPFGVVDFIDIGYGNVRFWTFNVADSAVTIGALLLALSFSREDRDQRLAQSVAERSERDAPEPGSAADPRLPPSSARGRTGD